MVRDESDGYICLRIRLIGNLSQLAYLIPNHLKGIDIKDGVHILNNGSKTFQSHTGIDILLLQLGIVTVSISVKLRKYIIPHFYKTIAIASYMAIRFSAAIFFSAVIINLRARATGTGSMLPEVILFSQTVDTVCRYADFLIPDFKCFIILQIDRRIETVLIQPDYFG